MEQNTLWGLPLSIVIVLIVELIKRLATPEGKDCPIPDRGLIAIAVVLGLGLNVLVSFAQAVLPGELTVWIAVVGGGLLPGLAACGLYDGFTKRA